MNQRHQAVISPAGIAAADDVLSVSQSSMPRGTIGHFGSDAVGEPSSGRHDSGSDDTPAARLGGTGIAVTIYLAVATLLVLRLAASMMAVARLRRQCVVVKDERWASALDLWRARLGINRRVPLLASDRVSVPIVAGWLRPSIIVPKALAAEANSTLIGSVLVHELAHVRRADFGWNLVRKLMQIVYWPHPLAWLVGRAIGSVREQACDDLCVYGLGGSAAYRNSLIEIAAGLVRLPDPALGMAMARATNLGRHLAWIDRTHGASRCLSHWPTRIALALAMLAAAGVLGAVELARASPKADDTPAKAAEMPQENPRADPPAWIEVTVRAKDSGRALAGATVRPSIDMAHSILKTDRNGQLRIGLFRRHFQDTFNFDVWADGYVQQRHFFAQNDARYQKIPGQVTIELLPGEQTLGGTVVDEHGRPVGGVNVKIWGYLGEKKQKDELAYMVESNTDDQGRWRCRCFRGMTFAYLYLSHPDYLADGDLHMRRHGRPRPAEPPQADEKPMEGLRDFSDVQVLTRGVGIAGEVRDKQGKPIAGAEVGWLEADHHDTFHDRVPTTNSDQEGRFRFPHARPGRLVIQVKAAGHAPELKPVEGKDGTAPVTVTLGPASTLAGRVVDSQGKPIPDAFVGIDTWRTYRSLGEFLKTDADGRFRWDDAPPDSVLINASRAGFKDSIQNRVSPDAEVVLTLKRSLSLSGRDPRRQDRQGDRRRER